MQPKILVIGEAMIDRYWIGDTSRISPEAPVPVVRITQKFDLPGGAGNVVANLEALGADVQARFHGGRPIKNRLMVGNEQLARWDENDSCYQTEWIPILESNINRYAGIIISDYGKGGFATTTRVEMMLQDYTGPIFIDTKQEPRKFMSLAKRATYFPNRVEFTQYETLYKGLDYILKKGADGLEYQDFKYSSRVKHLVSVSGAGDTIIAAYTFARCIGQAPHAALNLALDAAAVVCAKPYTATASLAEIERFQNEYTSN